ncbi:hypothetical protein EON80_28505, partial [bacterium]
QQCKIVVPLTWGWRKPVVLLPYDAEQWSAPKLRAVLLHELGHIVRGDWGFLLLAQLACVLYWFHPLVWMASRQLRAEIERATDDQVLATGMRPSEYVTYLMEFTNAAKLRMKSQSIGILKIERVSIGMTQAPTFKSRLEALLDPARNRQRPSRAQLVGFLGATSLTVLALAHFSDADAAPDSPYPLAKNVRVFGQVLDSGRRPISGAVVSTYSEIPRAIWGVTKSLSTTQSDNQGRFAVDLPNDPDTYRSLQIEKPGFGVSVGMISFRDAAKTKEWILNPPTSLSGMVTDENGKALGGIRVAARSLIEGKAYLGPVRGLETLTNSAGEWKIDRLPVGNRAEFEVLSPQFARSQFYALLEPKAASYPTLKLQRGFEARGRVLDINGQPVARAVVSLRSTGQLSAETDENGRFNLPGLTPIAQELEVQSP